MRTRTAIGCAGVLLCGGACTVRPPHVTQGRAGTPVTTEVSHADVPRLEFARSLALAPVQGDSPIDRMLAADRARLAQGAQDADAWLRLGRHWVRKAREGADPGFYLNAQAAAEVALFLAPDRPDALDLQGLVLLNDHRFEQARALTDRILAVHPDRATTLGLRSDALLELGRFDEAADAAQRMVDLHPDLPSYSRAAHLLWLQGDLAGAREAWRLALAAGDPGDPEPLAWVHVQAADVARWAGDPLPASRGYGEALRLVPDYPPALVGLARLDLGSHRPHEALPRLHHAFSRSPLPDTAWLLADAQAAAGDPGLEPTQRWLQAQAARVDPRTTAAWLASTRRDPTRAVELARQELQRRGDIDTEDVLAWALYRTGHLDEARQASDRSLRLGTKLPRLWFHAGAIRIAQGDVAAGRALVRDALQVPAALEHGEAEEARDLLADLGRR